MLHDSYKDEKEIETVIYVSSYAFVPMQLSLTCLINLLTLSDTAAIHLEVAILQGRF